MMVIMLVIMSIAIHFEMIVMMLVMMVIMLVIMSIAIHCEMIVVVVSISVRSTPQVRARRCSWAGVPDTPRGDMTIRTC